MNKHFLYLIIAILLTFCCNQPKKSNALHKNDCEKFKIGTFFNDAKTYKIVRKKNKQIEYDLKNNSEYHFEVHWLYDCAYNLIFKFSKNPIKQFNLKEKDKLRVQIVEIEENKTISEIDFDGKRYTQEFFKVE